jgi:hypothetical protein
MLTALLAGNVERAIELTSADEDAVLHDYGKFAVDRVHYGPAPVQINSISFTDNATSDGTLVTIKSFTATIQGQRISVSQQGGCIEFRGMGQDQRLCPNDLKRMMQGSGIPADVLQGLLSGSNTGTGIVTTESGGKWYVNPVRTLMNTGPKVAPLFGALLHASPSVSVGGGNSGGFPLPVPMPTHTR